MGSVRSIYLFIFLTWPLLGIILPLLHQLLSKTVVSKCDTKSLVHSLNCAELVSCWARIATTQPSFVQINSAIPLCSVTRHQDILQHFNNVILLLSLSLTKNKRFTETTTAFSWLLIGFLLSGWIFQLMALISVSVYGLHLQNGSVFTKVVLIVLWYSTSAA